MASMEIILIKWEVNMKNLKALILDVDGTLTDGGIYIGDNGEQFKQFHARDGYGIRHILPELGIIPVIITGRQSKIVENRCKELGISVVVQGVEDKCPAMVEILNDLGISPGEAAYMGDDLNDLECMKNVGIKACPKDAVDEIQNISDYVSSKDAGHGAVRDFIDWIKKNEKEIDS